MKKSIKWFILMIVPIVIAIINEFSFDRFNTNDFIRSVTIPMFCVCGFIVFLYLWINADD